MPAKIMDHEKHLWKNVSVSTPDQCWPFLKAKSNRYGVVNVSGKTILAHRLAWIYTNGPIPEGMFICHKCDNPACCNPDHLFLGTQDDNMSDARAKLRMHVGESNYNAKLTAEQVQEIVKLADGRMTRKEIGARFGVSRQTVSSILHNRQWAHLVGDISIDDRKRGIHHPQAKLNPEIVREIRRLHADGISCSQLGRNYSVSHETIRRIVHHQIWKEVN